MINFSFKHINDWKPEELHNKFGRFKLYEPGDGDINEGNFMAQLWFVDEQMNIYLIDEWDIREESKKPEET